MKRCESYTIEQYVAAQVELQMGDEMKREWGVFAADMERPPDVNAVLKFLRKRMRTLPDEPERISRPAPSPQRPKSDKWSGVWSLHETMPPPTCAACDESHLTY